jgi:hypothetical protein
VSREVGLIGEKTRGRKSRDSVPLTSISAKISDEKTAQTVFYLLLGFKKLAYSRVGAGDGGELKFIPEAS